MKTVSAMNVTVKSVNVGTKPQTPARTKKKDAGKKGERLVYLLKERRQVFFKAFRVPDDGKPLDAEKLAKLADSAGLKWVPCPREEDVGAWESEREEDRHDIEAGTSGLALLDG